MSANQPPPTGAPALRGPLASPGYWLHLAALAWRRELGIRLRPLGLTPTQFNALGAVGWLSIDGAEPSQQAVADFSGTDRMMMSRVLASLADRGLLERNPHITDARSKRLVLTERGRALVGQAAAIARAVDADLFGSLHDVGEFRDTLTGIAAESSR